MVNIMDRTASYVLQATVTDGVVAYARVAK